MLRHYMLKEQTFKNMIMDAKKQGEVQAKEFLSLAPMDPAQEILEKMSAFSLLQQSHIESMPETVQEKMFSMAGFQRESGKSARVLIETKDVQKEKKLFSGQRFQVGNLSFETNKDFTIRGNRLIGIYTKWEENIIDYSYILDENYPMAGTVFTQQPEAGMELYLVTDAIPEVGEDLIFYVQLAEEERRNASEGKSIFAQIQWQIYTKRGFMDIRCKDGTCCFVNSGELSFHIPKEECAVYEELPKNGYVIRGTLRRENYDVIPKIKNIRGFLFEVWQKETKSVCYTYSGKKQTIDLYCNIPENGTMLVFCKEKQEEGYHLYEEKTSGNTDGRNYALERLGYGIYRISFSKEGMAPGKFENAIKIVLYDKEMMKNSEVGCIYGYDNQKMILPAQNIVKESFSVIVEKTTESGEKMYYFIRPGSNKKEELRYKLNEKSGILEIEDSADFIDCKIYLGGCTVSEGTQGNIREGCRFQPIGEEMNILFSNPVAGKGGVDSEDIAQVRQRLIKDLKKRYTAVEAKDYEDLVRNTPQLCIDKVKAVWEQKTNKIHIAVKPVSNNPFPTLSEVYEKAIKIQLEKARLLTVEIEVCQPVYVPVDVSGTVYVKTNSERCRNQIEDVIKSKLDYVNTDKNFGEYFEFDELFTELEALECVKYIYDLSVSLSGQFPAIQKGFDIQPQDHCLLYPGKINLLLKTME